MDDFTNWTALFLESLRAFGEEFMRALPGVFGALLILLFGWGLAKLVGSAITRLLKLLRFDLLGQRIYLTEMLAKAKIQASPSFLVGRFVYWLLILLVIITASDTLGWSTFSGEISKLLSLLPNLFVAALFLVLGLYIAGFVRDFLSGATTSLSIASGKIVSQGIYYLLVVMVVLTTLDQAGVDISVITSNLMLILGAVLLSAALSYGLASRDVLSNILAGYFARSLYRKGQRIEFQGTQGVIVEITKVALILNTEGGSKEVIPTHHLMTERVKILEAE